MSRSMRSRSFSRRSREISVAGSATEGVADAGFGGAADPAFCPPWRLRQLRSIEGEMPSSPAIWTNSRPLPAGSVRARAGKYRLNWDEANRGHAACKMASTVAVLRRWSNLRQSAGTCWWWRERERRKLRSSS